MTFIASFITLLIERFFDCSHLRQWKWFQSYQQMIMQRIPGLSSFLGLAATIIPLMIAVMVLEFVFKGVLYGLLSLIFQIVVLLYCLGPKNLWAGAMESIASLAKGDDVAIERLALEFDLPVEGADAKDLRKQLISQMLVQANQRVLAVLFWFILLGPVGAVLYRLVSLSKQAQAFPGIWLTAGVIESALSWVSVRFFSLLFALGGNFNKTLDFWVKNISLGINDNDQFLSGCGLAALGLEEQGDSLEDSVVISQTLGLVDRVIVITLIILLIFVIAS